MTQASTPPRNRLPLQLFWAALIASWVTFLFFLVMPLGLLLWVGVLIYLIYKKKKLFFTLLLCSSWTVVPVISFISGTADYFKGTARFETVGLPDQEFYNLDPKWRVWNTTSGCVVMGFEPLTQIPNNWAVKCFTSLLGTQKGVYTGVYPTREQASQLISQGRMVPFTKNADTLYLQYNQQSLRLAPILYNDWETLPDNDSLQVAVLNNECLLAKMNGRQQQPIILLADKLNGRVFARYIHQIE